MHGWAQLKNQKIFKIELLPDDENEERRLDDEKGEIVTGSLEVTHDVMVGVVGVSSIRLVGKIK